MPLIVGTKGSAQTYKGTNRAGRYRGARPGEWIPPAIRFIGSSVGKNITPALPSHQLGDLILVFLYNDTVAATIPTPSGYTGSVSGFGNANSAKVAYRIATSNAETLPNTPDANAIVVHVYRGVDQSNPIGATAQFTNVVDVQYPALTLQVVDGTSWVAAIHGRRTGNIESAVVPSGTVMRSDTGTSTSGRVLGYDTDKGVTTWPQLATGGNNQFRYRSVSVELRAAK